MARQQDIKLFSGNDFVLRATIIDADTGLAYDLSDITGLVWAMAPKACPPPASSRYGRCTCRTDPNCGRIFGDAIVTKNLDDGVLVTDPTNGKAEVTINSDDLEPLCGKYYYEMQVVSSTGKRSTVLFGFVSVQENLIAAA